jgi:hypothetical protein
VQFQKGFFMALENSISDNTRKPQKIQFPQVVNRFFDLFYSLLAENEAHLARASSGKRPRCFDPQFYGWKVSENDPSKYKRQGRCIGWVSDEGEIYLSPHDAFDALEFWAALKGLPLPYTQRGLWKALAGHHVIVRGDGGNQPKRFICGEYKRVIHIPASSLVAWLARGDEEGTRWCFDFLRNRL